MEDAARPAKVAQVYGLNSQGQPVLLKVNDDGTLVQGTGGGLVEGMAQRVDEFVQIVGLNSHGQPILVHVNDDGTISGSSPSPYLPTVNEKAALDAANAPDGANPFATMADAGGGPATQIITTTGPATLDIGAIPDGDLLQRSGADIVGVAQPIKVIRLPFAWNDAPARNTGVLLYQPLEGDIFLGLAVHLTTAFNGTSPSITIYWNDGTDFYTDGSNAILYLADLTKVDTDTALGNESAGHRYTTQSDAVNGIQNLDIVQLRAQRFVTKAAPPAMKFAIYKDGGVTPDPLNSTQGAGFVHIIVIHA